MQHRCQKNLTKLALTLILIANLSGWHAKAEPNENLVIGVEDISYYPYFDYTKSETSLSKTILDKFAADNGYTITYIALPIKQFSKWLYENDIDFKYPDNKRWLQHNIKIHEAQYFSDGIVHMRAGTVVLLKNKDKPISFFKNLGMINGFDPSLWGQEIDKKKVHILDDSSPKVLVKHLINGIIDGVDLDIEVANHYLNSLGLDAEVTYSSTFPQYIFSHHLSTIKHPQIIQQFNQWLAKNSEFISTSLRSFNVAEITPPN